VTTWREHDGPLAALVAEPDAPTPRQPTPRQPVVMVHGFTQTGRSWLPIAERLVGRGHAVVLPDLPGHGRSATVTASLPATGDLLADLVDRTVGRPAACVGYSLGGRCALHLLVQHPDAISRLALVGAHPGLDDPNERAVRRLDDDALASRLEAEGIDAFLDHWLTVSLFGGFVPDATEQAIRRANTVTGLASSLRSAGTGNQESLWSQLALLPLPVLAMAGSRDTKFVALAQRLVATMPNAASLTIDGAAHMAHLERPDAVAAAIESFLDAD
jgi:2-succinyl-6-hydroxy-2,4-cyclohexadiene-1-carboxylate synthase